MAALGIDKAAVSKMISVASRIPAAVIEAIGPAPAIGRPRWIELADQFERKAMPGAARRRCCRTTGCGRQATAIAASIGCSV